MYKVLIIDDEPIIRKGLTNIISWNQLGCAICGEAQDGEAGEALIRELRPDIILTDIRMPKADGFTMVREIRDLVPRSKVIILTGYRDFNYAQEAIKLGAFDFILKPTKIEELTSVIQRAVRALDIEQHRDDEMHRFKALYEKNIPLMREKLLYNLLYGLYSNDADIAGQMDHLDLKIDRFMLGLIDNESREDKDGYDLQLYQFGIISTLEEVLAREFTLIPLALNSRWIIFVVNSPNKGNFDLERLHQKLTYLQEMIENCFSFTVSIALSSVGQGYKDIPAKFRECRQALAHRFYLGGNALISYQDLDAFFKISDHSSLEASQKQLLEQIKAGNRETAEETVEAIRSYVIALRADEKAYIKSFYLGTLSAINSIRSSLMTSKDNQVEIQGITSLYPMIDSCENVIDLNDILKEASIKAAENINGYNRNNMKLLVKSAVDYLKAHYQESITLNEVASKLFISSYYLSRMFKKETNQNFVDFLNEIRVEKAKELLKDIQFKTYEVADAVGISDAHYFSKLFKKYAGVTPTEFRDSKSPG